MLSSRDIELYNMRKNSKVAAFKLSNEERVSYMNECKKLQKLLK